VRHKIGQEVVLKQDKDYDGVVVVAGTKGTVTDVAPMFGSCWVLFEKGIGHPVLVPDDELDP